MPPLPELIEELTTDDLEVVVTVTWLLIEEELDLHWLCVITEVVGPSTQELFILLW